MMVERLTYQQAAERWDKALQDVQLAREDLTTAERRLAIATAEMHNALYERLKEPLP